MNKTIIICGGAGFIGSNLIKNLLSTGFEIVVVDNYSRGSALNIVKYISNPFVHVLNLDLSDRDQVATLFATAKKIGDIFEVWHLAANSDIPLGVENPDIDLKNTFLTTFELLRGMRQYGVKVFNFASSSAIYGDLGELSIAEDAGPLLPISNYGAMKLASEAQISAASEDFLDRANIFRFPNVVGTPATHGVILDFINKLAINPSELSVLGDGSQQKAYLHVEDLISAMLTVHDQDIDGNVQLVNIGPIDEGVSVSWIAEKVVERINPEANIIYGQGNKGWIGDVPKFKYSTNKLQSYGWSPKLNSKEAVIRAINEIAIQLAF